MELRATLLQLLSFAWSIASVLALFNGAQIISNTPSPIVVVLSESMEPAFSRGDIIFLYNPPDRIYHNGDIVVYGVPGNKIPIVHRIMETRVDPTASSAPQAGPVASPRQRMLTKGDNNHVDDLELYNGLDWLESQHIVGVVKGFLPFVGYASIIMNDYPQLKYGLFGGLALLSLFQT